MKRIILFAFAGVLCVAPLVAATLERLTLDDMITKSTSIVRGKVTGSYTAARGPVIYTHYTVQVSETYKGAVASTADVATPGGAANGLRQSFSGSPELNSGEEYVLFLWTSPSGLTQVIGLTQGVFTLSSASSGNAGTAVATRAATREYMVMPGTGVPVKGETLTMKLSDLRKRISAGLQKGVAQ